MEDSGFDSDPKSLRLSLEDNDVKISNGTSSSITPNSADSSTFKALRKSSDLQKKIERQREANRKAAALVDQPTNKKGGLLSRNRLPVPNKREQQDSADMQPLVMIDTDESEDEFAVPRLSKQAHREITNQLIKDGYNLDLEPDDEDLDLIPPRPVHERCICCNTQLNCAIQ